MILAKLSHFFTFHYGIVLVLWDLWDLMSKYQEWNIFLRMQGKLIILIAINGLTIRLVSFDHRNLCIWDVAFSHCTIVMRCDVMYSIRNETFSNIWKENQQKPNRHIPCWSSCLWKGWQRWALLGLVCRLPQRYCGNLPWETPLYTGAGVGLEKVRSQSMSRVCCTLSYVHTCSIEMRTLYVLEGTKSLDLKCQY